MVRLLELHTDDTTPGPHSLGQALLRDPHLAAAFGAQLDAFHARVVAPVLASFSKALSHVPQLPVLPPLDFPSTLFTLPSVSTSLADVSTQLQRFMTSIEASLVPFQRLIFWTRRIDVQASERHLCMLALKAADDGDIEAFDLFITEGLGVPVWHLNHARRLAIWTVLREGRWQHVQQPFHYLNRAARLAYDADVRALSEEPHTALMRPLLSLDRPLPGRRPPGPLFPLKAFDITYSVRQACQRLHLSPDATLMAQTQLDAIPRRTLHAYLGWEPARIHRAYRELRRSLPALQALLKKSS